MEREVERVKGLRTVRELILEFVLSLGGAVRSVQTVDGDPALTCHTTRAILTICPRLHRAVPRLLLLKLGSGEPGLHFGDADVRNGHGTRRGGRAGWGTGTGAVVAVVAVGNERTDLAVVADIATVRVPGGGDAGLVRTSFQG